MFIIKFFHTINKSIKKKEIQLSENNIVGNFIHKTAALRIISLLLIICIIAELGWYAYSLIESNKQKINIHADINNPGGITHKLPTINSFFSYNMIAPPDQMFLNPDDPLYIADNNLRAQAQEAEWQFEKDHYDTGIASLHLKGLKDRGDQAQLIKYSLLDTPQIDIPEMGTPTDLNTELGQIHNYCVNTAHLSEDQFEDVFLHYSDDTTLSTGEFIPGWSSGSPKTGATATSRDKSRVIRYDPGANTASKDFYLYNLNSLCLRGWMTYMLTDIMKNPQNAYFEGGHTYDGIFYDVTIGGGDQSFITTLFSDGSGSPVYHGGHITEYGNQLREGAISLPDGGKRTVNEQYAYDQKAAMTSIKDGVRANVGIGDFLMLPNTGSFQDNLQQIISDGSNGILTENFDGFDHISKQVNTNGEKTRWDFARYVTDKGGYFIWSAVINDADRELVGYNANNYNGAKGIYRTRHYPNAAPTDPKYDIWDVKRDGDGIEARTDMFAMTSYLMAMRDGHTFLFDRGTPSAWNMPASTSWIPAMGMNIGHPIISTDPKNTNRDSEYFLWKNSNAGYGPVNSQNDSAGQGVVTYRRDFDNAIVLFRTYDAYRDWNYGAPSPSYNLDGTYHVLYPNGDLGPAITQISLTAQEGVVLVKDGWDPMASTHTAPHAQMSLSNGGTHPAGQNFPVSVNFNPNSNIACSANIQISYPNNLLSINSVQLGSEFSEKISSSTDNPPGTINYNVGSPGCTTNSSEIMTINFQAKAAGSGAISFSNVEVVGGQSQSSLVTIPTDTQNTTVTVTESTINIPISTLTITNGATENSSGYYTTSPIVKLTATATGNTTIKNIQYQINNNSPVVTAGNTVNNITFPSNGTYTISYFATNNLDQVETAKTQTFKIDTSPAPKPTVDPYNQKTYRSSVILKGTKTANIAKIFVNDSEEGVIIDGNNWQKAVNLSITRGTNPTSGEPMAMPNSFIVKGQSISGVLSAADPVSITRHSLGDIDGDMTVGTVDLGGMMYSWHNLVNPLADLDFNNTCDLYDFGLLMANWNE